MFGVEFYDPDFVLISNKDRASRSLKQDIFKARMSTLDKVNEIKTYFGVSGDYKMFIISRNGELITIPVDSVTILSNWLDEYHYSADSKIYIAKGAINIEYFHTYTNWEDHPTNSLLEDIKTTLNIPEERPLASTLNQRRDLFRTTRKSLENGVNIIWGDNYLYKWIFNIDKNPQFSKQVKKSFRELLMNYRQEVGLQNQDPDVDTLLGELRLAIQNDPDNLEGHGPSITKVNEYFGLFSKSLVFSHTVKTEHLLRMIYGLYLKILYLVCTFQI